MTNVIATVSIHQPRSGLGIEVRVEFPSTGQTIYLPLPDRDALKAMRHKAGLYLERVVPLVARLTNSTEQAAEALRLLLNFGRELAGLLVQNDTDRFLRLEEAFRAAWPAWQAADWGADPDALPVVEMHCQHDVIPLELLPVFDFGRVPQMRTYDDLARAAARFLGFSTVVHRVLPSSITGDHVLRNVPALPVQFLRHNGLASAAAEERFLASLGGAVRVEGPWPDSEDEHTVRTTLIEALYAGAGLDGSPAGDPPVQVQHFACHCDTSAAEDEDYLLRLSTRRGKSRDISFFQLRAGYRDRLAEDRDTGRQRAVIVLNACASSRTNPLSAYSFPYWFLKLGHRAFVGTETAVPDAVAGGFAAAFYGRLLERRRRLGEAVVWARRDLLRDFRNPLGLLYVMYGDADLMVERANPGVYRSSPTSAAGTRPAPQRRPVPVQHRSFRGQPASGPDELRGDLVGERDEEHGDA